MRAFMQLPVANTAQNISCLCVKYAMQFKRLSTFTTNEGVAIEYFFVCIKVEEAHKG
jgi:hypothetical protein